MKKREQKELINLLDSFSKNLDCNWNCGNCEYGILRGYGDSWSCPLDLVKDMIFQKFVNPDEWRRLHG